jgi:hypothetical protein
VRAFVLTLLALVLVAAPARAQTACPPGVTCVPPEDMKVFLQLLKDQQCRNKTEPKLTLDPIVIITDHQGRVYTSGNDPKPYKLAIDWCNYQIDAKAVVKTQVAEYVAPEYGFRFRVKAALGYLPFQAIVHNNAAKAMDAGLLLEPFFLHWANLNVFVGFRSFGPGFGFDITRNFGAYLGYALTWGTWQSDVFGALDFAFW